ncbi:MAG: iron-sulfur cluster carrier protein ApbC [Alcaligenaceae bacterium]|nr:iron-sulfur cluster carrier protein ApbC [Alcaligenaceae bacterium]
MSITTDQIVQALCAVTDPNTKKKLPVTAKDCDITLQGNTVSVTVPLGYPVHKGQPELTKRIETALQALGLQVGTLHLVTRVQSHAVQSGLRSLPTVRNIIAVASGKGGVGKSTTAVNLALALSAQGARVGLLDADIYGPSVPIMLGLSGKPRMVSDNLMEPLQSQGVYANSIGFLIGDDAPAIWRGPMVTQALMQLLGQTAWPDLDYLIVDMPPGTGDIALTLSQKVPLTGAVIVTTPQDLALADARRGLAMFQKVNVPVLGVVENMSTHVCSQCGHVEPIFGEHGGRTMAADFNVPWLGALPLKMSIREQTDSGRPTVSADPSGPEAAAYHDIAARVAIAVATLPAEPAFKPTVVARKT